MQSDKRIDIEKRSGNVTKKKKIVKLLKGTFAHVSKTKLTLVNSPQLSLDLLRYELMQVLRKTKIGVLLRKEGLTSEEQMFGNGE